MKVGKRRYGRRGDWYGDALAELTPWAIGAGFLAKIAGLGIGPLVTVGISLLIGKIVMRQLDSLLEAYGAT